MAYLHLLDLIGTFAFAVYGAHKAIAARFDLFGVFTCGALTALGGGTIRELIINGMPSYFNGWGYWLAVALGVGFAIVVHGHFAKVDKYMLLVDAIGLATFAYIGAHRAEDAGLGLTGMVFFAVLTAAGGGVLSDVISGRRPEAFYKDFYPLAAILLAVAYAAIAPSGRDTTVALVLVGSAFGVRVASLRLKVRLWRPHRLRSPLGKFRLTKVSMDIEP